MILVRMNSLRAKGIEMNEVARIVLMSVAAFVVSFLVTFTATGGWKQRADFRRKAKAVYARCEAMDAEMDAEYKRRWPDG